jgi:hypothetical protein
MSEVNGNNNINQTSINMAYMNAMIGKGGEEKLDQVTDEIDENIKKTEAEIEKEKGKSLADLSPFEQMLLSIDVSLENAKRLNENKRHNFFREQQFKQYVFEAYGVRI